MRLEAELMVQLERSRHGAGSMPARISLHGVLPCRLLPDTWPLLGGDAGQPGKTSGVGDAALSFSFPGEEAAVLQ